MAAGQTGSGGKRGGSATEAAASAPAAGARAADPKRALILEAAGRLLTEKGYAGMTTLEVARAANISKRDLYARFPSKDDLLVGLIADGVKEMLIPVNTGAIDTRAEFYARLAAFGDKFMSEMLSVDRVSFYRLVIGEVPRNPDIGKTLLREGTEATVQRIGAMFGDAQARGLVRFDVVDPAIGAFFFALMGDLMISCLLDPSRVVSEDERRRHVGLALLLVKALDQIKS